MEDLEQIKIKAINFDLDTKKLKELNIPRSKAYSQIKKFLLKNGFKHRQWSGYLSKEPMRGVKVIYIVESLSADLPWLSKVIREFDVTNVEDKVSYIETIKLASNSSYKNIESSKIPKMKLIENIKKLEKYKEIEERENEQEKKHKRKDNERYM